jgi:hypothetical protein
MKINKKLFFILILLFFVNFKCSESFISYFEKDLINKIKELNTEDLTKINELLEFILKIDIPENKEIINNLKNMIVDYKIFLLFNNINNKLNEIVKTNKKNNINENELIKAFTPTNILLNSILIKIKKQCEIINEYIKEINKKLTEERLINK